MTANPYWNLNLGPAILMAALSLAALTPIAVLIARKRRRWRRLTFVALEAFLVLVNPLSNWVAFEPLNKHLLTKMADQARAVGFAGLTPEEVKAMFGAPSSVVSYSEGTVTWNYKPPWFYLMGSKFQAHFANGKVVSWEAYDD